MEKWEFCYFFILIFCFEKIMVNEFKADNIAQKKKNYHDINLMK